MSHVLPTPERVLPTLNRDGSRRWIRPRLYPGHFYRRRRVVGWALIALFALIPWLEWGGKPAVLFDIPHREFILFGRTFLPTDGVLLMLLLLTLFISIVLLSALFGRVWCGWGCPQTVYMELVFRPLERLFEGSRGQQLKLDREGGGVRRLLKYAAYVLVSALVANVFLSYFVGVETLKRLVMHPPSHHPTAFTVVLVTTALVFFDFAYFREQMCTVICPYARLQSVLLDARSLVVGYDARRGEPRRGQAAGAATRGDCVDCGACVVACPTGIDIRQGLQLECIACTQCVDACDSIMKRVNKPAGLIRYGSQHEFASGKKATLWRTRTLAYPAILCGLLGALFVAGRSRAESDVTILRGSTSFQVNAGQVQNQVRIKVRNRGLEPAAFGIRLANAASAGLVAPENPLLVEAGEQATTSVFVLAAPEAFSHGTLAVQFVIDGPGGFQRRLPFTLLGPSSAP